MMPDRREPYLGEPLTPREREVCGRLVDGDTARQIGAALGISPRTVEVHRKRIFVKVGVDKIAKLVRVVMTHERTENCNG